MASNLELPMSARIHLVFHVSQLKKKLGNSIQVQNQVPTDSIEQILDPEYILEQKMVNKADRVVTDAKQLPIEEATWEEYWKPAKFFQTSTLRQGQS